MAREAVSRGLELADPLNDILLSLDTIVLLQLALLPHPKCSRLAKLHRGVVPHTEAAAQACLQTCNTPGQQRDLLGLTDEPHGFRHFLLCPP